MGPDRTAVARKRTTRRPVARPPRGGERHPVEAAYGGSLARPARALRTLANLLRSLLPLAQGTAPGTGYWPMPKPRPTRSARSSGWSAWTAPSLGRTSMPRVPAEGRASKTQKGGLAPRGRGARAQPWRANDQAASGLRRQGPAAVGGRDPGPAPREHPARGGTRRDTCEAPRWSRAAEQAPDAADRGQGLQLPELPAALAATRHPAHDTRAP